MAERDVMRERSPVARVAFWAGAAVGWTVIAIGARGVLRDSDATRPGDLGRWFVGLLLVHDLVLVPLVLAVGWFAGRVLPARAVVHVRLGLAASAVLVAVAFPLVRGYGEREGNPSLLPLPYGRNLVIALVLAWAVIGAALVVAAVRARR
jgi:hypothetical protein